MAQRESISRPILFSGPMVRALLEGRKTQTRRVMKPQPVRVADTTILQWKDGLFQPERLPNNSILLGHCPYGQPGDLLWVRETWMDLRGTGIEHRPTPDSPIQRYAYGAQSPPGSASDEARKDFGLKWRPSIHMPRWASRLTLRITDVRVQRLQEINYDDARAEGVEWDAYGFTDYLHPGTARRKSSATQSFLTLWESINGPGSWDANPWVWSLSFDVLRQNVNEVLSA